VFVRLRESARETNRSILRLGVVSFGVHATLILGGAYAFRSASRNVSSVPVDAAIVLLAVPQEHSVAVNLSPKAFLTIVPPQIPPTTPPSIPSLDLQQHFDPRDYPGPGVAGGLQNGDALADNQVYAAAVVEEGPALLSPPLPYPELLRRAGIEGRVLLQAIVDTAGRVEPNSVKILKSSSPGFSVPTRRWALAARFRPARLQGRAVRVLVNLPVEFASSNPSPGG
jgi:TonB family protein